MLRHEDDFTSEGNEGGQGVKIEWWYLGEPPAFVVYPDGTLNQDIAALQLQSDAFCIEPRRGREDALRGLLEQNGFSPIEKPRSAL